MNSHGKVQLITPGQVREMSAALARAIPLDMDTDVAQGWIGNQESLARQLRSILLPILPDVSILLADQHSFYRQFFNLDLDFSKVHIPTHTPGFDRLIVVAQGLTPNKVYNVCVQHFPCWRYTDDLDATLDWGQEERSLNKNAPYAIWVRDCQEADEELKDLSADQLKKKNHIGITLTERLLLELKYWSETKEHLDIYSITLCAGSRGRRGFVPYFSWYCGRLGVDWYGPGHSCGILRARAVVS